VRDARNVSPLSGAVDWSNVPMGRPGARAAVGLGRDGVKSGKGLVGEGEGYHVAPASSNVVKKKTAAVEREEGRNYREKGRDGVTSRGRGRRRLAFDIAFWASPPQTQKPPTKKTKKKPPQKNLTPPTTPPAPNKPEKHPKEGEVGEGCCTKGGEKHAVSRRKDLA